MPNVLQNVFKTAGIQGQQPWKQYYQGIKPQNPLGGDFVRRMGNKVKAVVPSTTTKQMQFSYMNSQVANFKSDPNYIPPYKPLPGQQPQFYTVNQTSPEYYYAGNQPMSREEMKARREMERSAREERREGRRAVSDTRANYRTLLDTAREVRNWSGTLGVV